MILLESLLFELNAPSPKCLCSIFVLLFANLSIALMCLFIRSFSFIVALPR